jgi:hypothetical protein
VIGIAPPSETSQALLPLPDEPLRARVVQQRSTTSMRADIPSYRHNDGSVQLVSQAPAVTPPWVLAAAASDQTFVHHPSRVVLGNPAFAHQAHPGQFVQQPSGQFVQRTSGQLVQRPSARSVHFQSPSSRASNHHVAASQPLLVQRAERQGLVPIGQDGRPGSSGSRTPYTTAYPSQEPLWGSSQQPNYL